MITLTPSQLQILQHAIGADQYGYGGGYRNHFCAGGTNVDRCRELVAMSYMQQHPTTELLPYYNCSVTEAGEQAVREQSPKPPKLTRSQHRYRDFLNADTGYSFGEWLKAQQAAKREKWG